MNKYLERTLVIIKPDALERGIAGEILTRFEKAGLKIVAMKMAAPEEAHFHKHYEEISHLISRWGDDVYNAVVAQMMEAPVIAFVLEGVEAISYVRKIVGTTNPKDSLPGTIRCDYTHITRDYTEKNKCALPTIVHASGNAEEAGLEIALWFTDSEIYDYETVQAPTLRGDTVKKNK